MKRLFLVVLVLALVSGTISCGPTLALTPKPLPVLIPAPEAISAPTPTLPPLPTPNLTPTPMPEPMPIPVITADNSSPSNTVNQTTLLFIGDWINEDPNTRGITRIVIHVEKDSIIVHMWAKCHPADCDWGEEEAVLTDPTDGVLSVTWDKGFAIKTQQCTLLSDGRLKVESHTNYIDNSGRFDSNYVYYFRKDMPATPPSPPPTPAPAPVPTITPPEWPIIAISPPDYTTTVKMIFKWKPVTGATGYECQLATSLLFTPESLIIDNTGTNALDETTPIEVRVPYDNTYYWRIRTCGADEVSDWSETMSITLPTVEDGEWSDEPKVSFLPSMPPTLVSPSPPHSQEPPPPPPQYTPPPRPPLPPPYPQEPPPPQPTGEERGFYFWVILIALILVLSVWFMIWKIKKGLGNSSVQ